MNLFNLKLGLILTVLQICFVSTMGISVNFTYQKLNNCAPAIVEFSNTSASGPGITYKWNFGLGAIVTTTDNSIKKQLYTKPGQYKVTLVVTDGTSTDSSSAVITISQGPVAKISANPVSGCKPLLVNYSSTSTAGDSEIAATTWDFRNGDYLKGTSVKYTYQKAGKYGIALKVTDKNGCSAFLETDSLIKVVDKPKINFSATDTFTCEPPLNVSFKNLSTASSNLTYKWNFGNGQTSKDIGKSIIYNSIGSYDVSLAATDQYGCSDSILKKAYIKIGNPQGSLDVYDSKNKLVTKTSLCSGTYKFVFSVGNMPDYTWIINDNNKVTTINGGNTLTYQVKDTGKLEINLIYGKNSLCTENIQKTFTKSSVKADFTLNASLLCSLPQKVNLINGSKSVNKYSWYLSNRLISNKPDTSYTLTYTDAPKNTFKRLYSHEIDTTYIPFSLVVTNNEGCTDSVTRVTSLSFPLARFMPNKVSGCAPLVVSFSDSSKSAFKIDEFAYKIGSETITSSAKTPVNYTFTTPGEYFVNEIITSSGCRDTSYAVKIVVGEKLTPDFTVTPSEVCNGSKIQLAASSNNNSVVKSWHIKSNNVFDYSFKTKPDTAIMVYTDTLGFKNISLEIDYNGCLSEITKTDIYKIKGSTGNFTETFSCDSALVYRFKSKILPATSLTWNIDNNTFTNKDSIRYKFPVSGNYTAKLTVLDGASGCELTQTKQISARQIKAGFTLNDSIFCVGDSVLMDASSSKDYINTCYNEGFLWDFGDNSPPRRTFTTDFDHIYTSKGKYKILLLAKAENGCIDSARRFVSVFRPAGTFTSDKKFGCLPAMDVKFENTSTDTTIVNWTWDFGDEKTDNSNNKQITHTYSTNQQQTFNATLTVFDAYQCNSSMSIPITLTATNSDFQANDNAICIGQSVTLTPADTKLDSVLWNFGDGTLSKIKNSNTYNHYGLYNISLTAYKNGCGSTTTKNNYVSVEKADAKFTVNDSVLNCYPETLYVRHKNLNSSPVVERTWIFDSNELYNKSDSVMYIYTRPGSYTTRLNVKTLNGCTASSSKNIIVKGPTAGASFSPKKICFNETVNFQIDSMKNVNSFKWIFGDGNSAIVSPVTHKYTSQGYIIPAIQLINGNCTVTKTLDTLFVSFKTLNYSRIPLGDTAIYLGDSIWLKIITNTNNVTYTWTPENAISCLTCNNPLIAPLNDITYVVTMKDNCLETSENFTVKVLLDYYLNAPAAFTPNGDSNNDVLKFEQKNIQNFELKVFNRWGKIVFSTNDINEGWDGTTNGKAQNSDTYTYWVKAETISGYKFEKKGSFLLIK